MPGRRNRKWAKVPNSSKRGGCAIASEDTKAPVGDRSVDVSGATAATEGRKIPSSMTGKTPDLSFKTQTDAEKIAGQSNATLVEARKPTRTWAVVAASAPEPKEQQQIVCPADHGLMCGNKPAISYAAVLKAPAPKGQPKKVVSPSTELASGKSADHKVSGLNDRGEVQTPEEKADVGKDEIPDKKADWADVVPQEPFEPMGMSADPANPDHLIPSFKKEQCVVCCIDLENNCFNQSREEARRGIRSKVPRTCEVGMALVDSRELSWEDKGDRWYKAWPAIYSNAADFAIREHEHGPSHTWTWDCGQGRPENFLYGDPTWVGLADIKSAVVGKIRAVLEKEDETGLKPAISYQEDENTDVEDGQVEKDASASEISTQDKEDNEAKQDSDTSTKGPRKVIFVFFAGDGDRKWLRNLGIDLSEEFPNSSIVDLQRGFVARKTGRVLNKSQCSFGDYMHALGLENPGAHNGGNDAVHGLQAFLAELALNPVQHDKLYGGDTLPMLIEEEQDLEAQTEVGSSSPGKVTQSGDEESTGTVKSDATGSPKDSDASAPVKEAPACL